MNEHTYKIDLELETTAKSRVALADFRKSISEANGDLDAIEASYNNIAKSIDDATSLEKEMNRQYSDRISSNNRLIEQYAKELETNKELTEDARSMLKNLIKQRGEDNKRLKIRMSEFKQARLQEKIEKSKRGIAAEILKGIKEQVKQTKLMQTLTDKELKTRTKIAKIIADSAKISAKGVKAAGKVIGGGAAIGGALIGGAIAGAEEQASKERALQSLKSGIDPSVVESVYIKSGADYSSIVNAINSLADVTKDAGMLTQGAVLELQNPGIGKLLLSTKGGSEGNISKLNAAILQIKKQTGIQDISGAIEASTKARSVTQGKVSQTEYLQAYASLSQAGIDEESINRIIRRISEKSGDFIENFNKADIASMVYDRQLRNRINNSDLGIEKLDLSKASESSPAQNIVEKLREFELKKNEILVKMLPVAEKILASLEPMLSSDMIGKIADGFVKLFTSVLPLLGPIMEALQPVLDLLEPILKMLQPVIEWLVKISTDFVRNFVTPMINKLVEILKENIPMLGGIAEKAQGGLVTSPSICGEAGPELVLPLSNPSRAQSIVNNYTNTNNFSLSGPQTALSISQQISNNRFVKHACRGF